MNEIAITHLEQSHGAMLEIRSAEGLIFQLEAWELGSPRDPETGRMRFGPEHDTVQIKLTVAGKVVYDAEHTEHRRKASSGQDEPVEGEAE